MPFAVTHILAPLILVAIIRDFFLKKKFSLHYVLIAGLAGILPDIDVALFWVLYFFGFTFEQIHKTFLHSLFIPLFFFLLYLTFLSRKDKNKKLRLSIVFLMLAIGSLIHLILDGIFGPTFQLFYPISNLQVGFYLTDYLPYELQSLFLPSLDALLLIIWLIYLEVKHKISDFI